MIPAPKNIHSPFPIHFSSPRLSVSSVFSVSHPPISIHHRAKRHPLTMIHRAKQHPFVCLDLKINIEANYSYSTPFLPRQRAFVPDIFLKSTRITLGTCAKRMDPMSENRRSPTNSPSSPLKRTDLHKKCKMPKGKKHLNRGLNQPPYLPFPFLVPVQTPGFLSKITSFPFTANCLNIIEPRFEPPTLRASPTFDHFSSFPIHYSPSSNHRPLSTEHRKLITDVHPPPHYALKCSHDLLTSR